MANPRDFTLGNDAATLGDLTRLSTPQFTTEFRLQNVDVAPVVTQPRIVREGFNVPSVFLDPERSNFFIEDLPVVNLRDEPRVIAQSIAPGTMVPRGTSVNLTVVPANAIKFDIFQNPHTSLANRTVTEIADGILQDPEIRQTLLRYSSADAVPAADRTKLINAFRTQANVEVNDADAKTNFAAAFNAIRGAIAFR